MAASFGVALGGGGVRGLANIGFLKALEKDGLRPSVVAGTSMGAVVGVIYAQTLSALQTEKILKEFLESSTFRDHADTLKGSGNDTFWQRISDRARKGYYYYRVFLHRSVINPEAFLLGMDELIPDISFEDLPMSFGCNALNICQGTENVMLSGPLRQAIKATCAVPGILPPVVIDGENHVDGGWAEAVPVSVARKLGGRYVVGVDVSQRIEPCESADDLQNTIDIITRADEISRRILNRQRAEMADLLVAPQVRNAVWYDFDHIDDYIEAGFEAGEAAIPYIKKRKKAGRI